MGNFLFRTADYRQNRRQLKATQETNALLAAQLELQRQAALVGTVSPDGKWTWDGRQWLPRG